MHERLTKEIAYGSGRWMRLKEDQEAGKDVRLNLDNIQRTINDLNGRIKGATTITVTKNEIFHRWNQGGKYHLAIVLVGKDNSIDGPHYVPHPFKQEPGWGVASVNYDLKALLESAAIANTSG